MCSCKQFLPLITAAYLLFLGFGNSRFSDPMGSMLTMFMLSIGDTDGHLTSLNNVDHSVLGQVQEHMEGVH